MSSMTGDVNRLTDEALENLAAAERRGLVTPGPRSVIEQSLRGIATEIEGHATEVVRVRGDARLSEAGKNERYRELYESAHEQLTGHVNSVTKLVDAAISRARDRATPKPGNVPEQALQAQLSNARTDARMVLDGTPEDDLTDALAELAENGNPAMRHLILGTDWPELYFRSRSAATADALWANRKPSLMPLVLDEAGQEALHTLTAEDDLRTVGRLARVLRDFWAVDMKPRNARLPLTPGG